MRTYLSCWTLFHLRTFLWKYFHQNLSETFFICHWLLFGFPNNGKKKFNFFFNPPPSFSFSCSECFYFAFKSPPPKIVWQFIPMIDTYKYSSYSIQITNIYSQIDRCIILHPLLIWLIDLTSGTVSCIICAWPSILWIFVLFGTLTLPPSQIVAPFLFFTVPKHREIEKVNKESWYFSPFWLQLYTFHKKFDSQSRINNLGRR